MQDFLLVADDREDEETISRALVRLGHVGRIRVARNGPEAVRCLFGDDIELATPGLVLLDLKVPKADCVEVLRRMRADKRTELIPVVVLTSPVRPEDCVSCYRNYANAYVRKPLKSSQFAEFVHILTTFWLLMNETPPTEDRG
jgi:CheY-like chemotaxis protein